MSLPESQQAASSKMFCTSNVQNVCTSGCEVVSLAGINGGPGFVFQLGFLLWLLSVVDCNPETEINPSLP